MRLAVAGEETLQPGDIRAVGSTHDQRPADAALDQADAAEDQRPHDALAKVGLGDQKPAQAFRRNDNGLDFTLGRASTSEARPESCPTSPMNWPGP